MLALACLVPAFAARPAAASLTIKGRQYSTEEDRAQLLKFLKKYKSQLDLRKFDSSVAKFLYFLMHTQAKFDFPDEATFVNAVILGTVDSFSNLTTVPKDCKDVQSILFLRGLRSIDRSQLAFMPPSAQVPPLEIANPLTKNSLRLPLLKGWAPPPPPVSTSPPPPVCALSLYRTMNRTAAKNLAGSFQLLKGEADKMIAEGADSENLAKDKINTALKDSKGLYGHYGDLFQASTYTYVGSEKSTGKSTDETTDENPRANYLVRFQLKPGIQYLLFSPLVSVVSDKSKRTKCADRGNGEIAQPLQAAYGRVYRTKQSDAYQAGYIGIKHEARGDFSLAVSKSMRSQLLLLWLVDKIEILPMDDEAAPTTTNVISTIIDDPFEPPKEIDQELSLPVCRDTEPSSLLCTISGTTAQQDQFTMTCEDMMPMPGTYYLVTSSGKHVDVTVTHGPGMETTLYIEGDGLGTVVSASEKIKLLPAN